MTKVNYIKATCVVYFSLKIRGNDKSEQNVLSYAAVYGNLSIM
jgi:hypothetical protein